MPIIFWPTGQGAGTSGSCDYPAVGDVQEGVVYGGGTGTLVVPAEADVRSGVGYGAGGTEFEGELYAISTAAGSLLARLRLAVAVMRANGLVEQVGYRNRTTGDAYTDSEMWEARRLPQTSADAGGLPENTATWGMYRIGGQTRLPARLGKLTDSAGVVWHVQRVVRGYGETAGTDLHFLCECVKEV